MDHKYIGDDMQKVSLDLFLSCLRQILTKMSWQCQANAFLPAEVSAIYYLFRIVFKLWLAFISSVTEQFWNGKTLLWIFLKNTFSCPVCRKAFVWSEFVFLPCVLRPGFKVQDVSVTIELKLIFTFFFSSKNNRESHMLDPVCLLDLCFLGIFSRDFIVKGAL